MSRTDVCRDGTHWARPRHEGDGKNNDEFVEIRA